MASIKKLNNGEYYLFQKKRMEFLIKAKGNSSYVSTGGIYAPKEIEGKRIRLKVEFVDDGNESKNTKS